MTKNYLSPSAAAHRLDVTLTTIYKMLREETVKGIKFGGRWRIPMPEIERIERFEATPKRREARG